MNAAEFFFKHGLQHMSDDFLGELADFIEEERARRWDEEPKDVPDDTPSLPLPGWVTER